MRSRKYYLKLTLQGLVSESPPSINPLGQKKHVYLRSLLELLSKTSQKKRLQTLLVSLKDLQIGWGQLYELREAIAEFRKNGKKVYCHLEKADNKSVSLGSVADKLFMTPAQTLDLVGLRAENLFFKNLFDSIGIEAQLFSIGAYKSAAEIFQREDMSDENREMTRALLGNLQEQVVAWISESRGVTAEKVVEWIDRGPFTAGQAKELGIIDEILYEDEVEKSLRDGNLKRLPASKVRVGERLLKRLLTFRRPQIAYIVGEGMIMEGEKKGRGGRWPSLGHRSLSRFIDDARKRKRVRGIVLRINSPGGSSTASDLLWRAVKRAAEAKALVVSFGDIAASGGFYVATASNKIFSAPTTLTGSIGVIGGKFVVRDLMNKLGVTADSVDCGRHSGYSSASRPFTDEEAATIQEQMLYFYENLFLAKTAESRGMEIEEIRGVAEGRVWTGEQARERSLVDEIGGSQKAIQAALELANLKGKKYRLKVYSPRQTLKDLLPWNISSKILSEKVFALMPEIKID